MFALFIALNNFMFEIMDTYLYFIISNDLLIKTYAWPTTSDIIFKYSIFSDILCYLKDKLRK